MTIQDSINQSLNEVLFHTVQETILGCKIPTSKLRDKEHLLEWSEQTLKNLLKLKDGLPFVIGDFCNQMRDASEDWEQILPDLGEIGAERKLKTLQNWASVLDRYEQIERVFPLPYSHYAEVAYVRDKDLRHELLNIAFRDRLSVEELRELKKRMTEPEIDHDEENETESEPATYPRALVERTLWVLAELLDPDTISRLNERVHQNYDEPEMLELFDLLAAKAAATKIEQ